MKMDSRDSAECQNWEKKDINVIIRIDINEEKDKIVNNCPLPLSKGEEMWKRGEKLTALINKPNPVQGPPNLVIAEPVCNPEVVESYGPWMLAKPRYRKGDRTTYTKFHGNIRKNDGGNPRRRETITTTCNRSRYSVLLVNDPL